LVAIIAGRCAFEPQCKLPFGSHSRRRAAVGWLSWRTNGGPMGERGRRPEKPFSNLEG
jgi:hypothetical protein